MRDSFDDLVRDAEQAPIGTWDFTWLDGRAVEDRPTWRYFDQVVARSAGIASLLDVQAGVGSMIGNLPSTPTLAVAAEGYPPSVTIAAPRLRARGIHLVVTAQDRADLPFADGTFDLVISRHPVAVWWDEIARVLRPGGVYFAQHVGPHSLRSLSEHFLGPTPDTSTRDPEVERRAAEDARLVVQTIEVERPRIVFYDIGAVVYFLRLVPWIVPGFTTIRFRDALRALHETIERDGAFVSTASRTLIEAAKLPA